MAEFQVTYNTKTTETVEADSYKELRGWIIFMVEAEDQHRLPELNQETLASRVPTCNELNDLVRELYGTD